MLLGVVHILLKYLAHTRNDAIGYVEQRRKKQKSTKNSEVHVRVYIKQWKYAKLDQQTRMSWDTSPYGMC